MAYPINTSSIDQYLFKTQALLCQVTALPTVPQPLSKVNIFLLKMDNSRPHYRSSSFFKVILHSKIVDFNGLQTRIGRVEGEHADHHHHNNGSKDCNMFITDVENFF